MREKQILFPFINQLLRSPEDYAERENIVPAAVKSHRLQIRDGTLKFRLNDGNLRIGRGFGKRSFETNPMVDKYNGLGRRRTVVEVLKSEVENFRNENSSLKTSDIGEHKHENCASAVKRDVIKQ